MKLSWVFPDLKHPKQFHRFFHFQNILLNFLIQTSVLLNQVKLSFQTTSERKNEDSDHFETLPSRFWRLFYRGFHCHFADFHHSAFSPNVHHHLQPRSEIPQSNPRDYKGIRDSPRSNHWSHFRKNPIFYPLTFPWVPMTFLRGSHDLHWPFVVFPWPFSSKLPFTWSKQGGNELLSSDKAINTENILVLGMVLTLIGITFTLLVIFYFYQKVEPTHISLLNDWQTVQRKLEEILTEKEKEMKSKKEKPLEPSADSSLKI